MKTYTDEQIAEVIKTLEKANMMLVAHMENNTQWVLDSIRTLFTPQNVSEIRNAALEEAAVAAEQVRSRLDPAVHGRYICGYNSGKHEAAEQIRALKTNPPPPAGE